MANIEIMKQKETNAGWKLKTAVDGLEFTVTVDREYWQKLTSGREEVSGLVRRSFAFLLAREPKESILRNFNLKDIERYFPDYPREVGNLSQ